MQRIEPRATGQEARMPSSVLWITGTSQNLKLINWGQIQMRSNFSAAPRWSIFNGREIIYHPARLQNFRSNWLKSLFFPRAEKKFRAIDPRPFISFSKRLKKKFGGQILFKKSFRNFRQTGLRQKLLRHGSQNWIWDILPMYNTYRKPEELWSSG